MNRLRRHKKEKAAAKQELVSEKASSSTTTIISSITPTRKEKELTSKNDDSQQTTSPKASEFDLANALPAPDDFRTSLLMPKLSARFSMLKEQDDPESLLGKASDDSVLFPKRASRLNLLGPNHLADIDEMSINSRPSAFGQDSNDGYGTDDDRSQAGGSVMSRARRAEVGNNLFGGRQKVYKIPARSRGTSPIPEAGRSGLGRAVYEHDVTLSAFQRLRLKEKEERSAAEDSALNSPTFSNEDALSSVASTNRTTYSSTASGPPPTIGRASTAATSIDEQPLTPQSLEGSTGKQFPFPERGAPKPTRRYGQGLAQSAQNQQTFTLNRLESLGRQRPGTPEFPQMNRAFSRSTTSLRDRLQRLPLVDAARPSSRPTSPPLSTVSPRPQLAESEPKDPVPNGYGLPSGYNAPPLSPPISEVEEQAVPLAAALQPEDHGKATASGLFNKPRAAFDEQQFTQRQLQMHEGRNTPPLRRPPSPARNAPVASAPNTLPQDRVGRSRGFSNASSYRSRPKSASSHYSEAQRTTASPARNMNRTTFFRNSSPSDSGDEEENIHPAFRSRTPSKPPTPTGESQERHPLPEVRFSDLGDLKPIAENEIAEKANSQQDGAAPQEPDSPTLPSGLGLSGLVRTHLRRDSDRSIQLPSPGLPPKLADNEDVPELKQDTAAAAAATAPNPGPADEPSSQSTISADSKTPEDQPEESQGRTSNDSTLDDESRYSGSHRRNASTETQREREEFANELAERRRRVQEKLQNFTDIESRPGSRAPSRAPSRSASRPGSPSRCGTPDSTSQVKPGNAFALLRSRAGKHHLFQKSGNSSTSSLVNLDDPWREEDERVPFPSLSTQQLNSSAPHILAERPSVRSRVAAFTRGSQEASRESSHSRNASPHSFFRARRDRSGSDASCRSKSRLRGEDLGTVDERSVASHETSHFESSYEPRGYQSVPSSTRPSIEGDERSSSRGSGRFRSGSRSGTSSYFDLPPPPQHHPPPVPGPSPAMIGNAPRPSPIAPYSANATPPLDLTPSPSSPPAPTFAAAAGHVVPQRAPGHNGLQKRPINKLQISEPTLVSCTSNVPTIGLPPGASLTNGIKTPPVPPMNPRRRRQTTTQTILGALKGEKQDTESIPASEYAPSGRGTPAPDERSLFDDERPLSRNRLRKTSSEGGSLNVRARQDILSGPPPPMPYPPPSYPPPKVPMDGGMF